MQIGDHVIYVNPTAGEQNALVAAVWERGHTGDSADTPSLNLVLISEDENETDQYGRQTKRVTSIPHEQHQMAHGNFWKPKT